MSESDNGNFSTFNRRTNIVTAGVMLVILYALCVYLVVVSFSAYVIRTDWNGQLSASDTQVKDLDNLVYLIKQDDDLRAQVASYQDEIEAANKTIAEATAKRDDKRDEIDAADLAVTRLTDSGRQHLQSLLAQLETADREAVAARLTPNAQPKQIAATLAQVANATFVGTLSDAQIDKARERAAELEADLVNARLLRTSLQQELQTLESDTDRAHEMRSHNLLQQTRIQDALENLRKTLPVDSEYRARWGSLVLSGWWNPVPSLVASPTILVTLLATIAAGALGTLVAYSRSAFLEQNSPRISRLLITLGEGIAAAIGIFLFAGSGMLVLTQGGGSEGRLELSPFTVAFLAFLSGFLAESAFSKIATFGKDLFGADDQDQGENGAEGRSAADDGQDGDEEEPPAQAPAPTAGGAAVPTPTTPPVPPSQ